MTRDAERVQDNGAMNDTDYMGLALWDLAMPGRGPVATYPVHDGLRARLADLYGDGRPPIRPLV